MCVGHDRCLMTHLRGFSGHRQLMSDSIVYRRAGHVGRLLLNCPEVHNALGCEQLDMIIRYLETVSADDEIRVLVVTGAGNKTFCAGASLRELGSGQLKDDAFQRMTGLLASLRVPTICALNGNVFGGGVELAAEGAVEGGLVAEAALLGDVGDGGVAVAEEEAGGAKTGAG